MSDDRLEFFPMPSFNNYELMDPLQNRLMDVIEDLVNHINALTERVNELAALVEQ